MTSSMNFARTLLYPPVSGEMVTLSADDRDTFASIFREVRDFSAGDELIQENVTGPRVFGIESGWLACYKLLRNGRRQVTGFRLPGDLLGLRDLLLRRASHSSVALTAGRVRSARVPDFIGLMERNSRLMAGTFWMLGHEEAEVVDSLVRLGQQTALERTADLIYGIWLRLDRIGQAGGGSFQFPISHAWIANALGISTVHLSRMLRKLHELRLMEVKHRTVRILSRERLVEFLERHE